MKMLWGVVVLLAVLVTTSLASCPQVCLCKWKGGKQTVECRNQGLETLPESIDPETQVLDISGNKLSVLPAHAFRNAGLLNLQKIHIRNSRLTQIDPHAFSQLINLVDIDLSDNLLESVPSQAFKETPFVRELSLGGNPIRRLRSGAFSHVTQLVKLDLSRCQLTDIEPQAFAHLQTLETLKISSNRLTIISNATVKSLWGLHGMELHDNPWHCDCALQELKLWMETRNVPHPISPTCHSPQRLAHRKFAELPVSEFACAPRMLDTSREVSVFEGENATLECAFEATPSPSVRWYLSGRPIANNTNLSIHRKFIIFQESHKSSLVLLNGMGKDGGDFFCVVENAAGFVEANFTLNILPQPPFHSLLEPSTQLALLIIGVIALLILILAGGVAIFLLWRWRGGGRHKPPEMGAGGASTPVKPPRLNYEINAGSLVSNGFGTKGSYTKGDPSNDNPDLILETNQGTYAERSVDEESVESELQWGVEGYRTMEYPSDYGLPIIHENSVYSDSTFYGDMESNSVALPPPPPLHPHQNHTLSHSHSHNHSHMPQISHNMWAKGKVGARITAPTARDSPDEGYQEGYVGTDV